MNGTLNVLDWSGPTFLLGYAAAIVVVLGLRLVLGHLLKLDPSYTSTTDPTDAYDAAMILEGPRRVVATAVARLVARGEAQLYEGEHVKRIESAPSTPYRSEGDDTVPLDRWEQAVLDQLGPRASVSLGDLTAGLADDLEAQRVRLSEGGMLDRSPSPWLYTGLLGVIGGVGIMKMMVGMSRGRSVGLLVIFTILLGVLAVVLHRRHHRTTPASALWLDQKRTKFDALQVTASSSSEMLSIDDVGWALVLFGSAVFDGSQSLDSLPLLTSCAEAPKARAASGVGWWAGLGCGGSSCGGSSCGFSCGGGCGGGCGGCGS